MTTPAPPAQAPPRGPQGPPAAAAPPGPFPVGVFEEEIQNSYDRTVTVAAATVQFPGVEIEPDGWARGWWFDFDMVAASNAAVVAFTEDFPFAAISTVLLKGTNVPQTFGPFSGFDWDAVNKYGGYQPVGDPRNDQAYNGGPARPRVTRPPRTLYPPPE